MMARILALFGYGRITLVDDTGPVQLVQINEGQIGPTSTRILSDIPRVAEFGFASVPPLQSDVVTVRFGGNRAQSIVIGTNHQPSRPRGLSPGDTCLYDVRRQYVRLTASGLEIDCAGLPAVIRNCSTLTITATEKVTIDAPAVECTGSLKVDQMITGDGTPIELGALRDAFNAHKHTGVSTGSGTSGGTDRLV